MFAEALAFYSICIGEKTEHLVVYRPLEKLNTPLKTVIRGIWPENSKVYAMQVTAIKHLVGIWESPKSSYVYVLRKHPGLDMLDPSQCGLTSDVEQEMDEAER